MTRRAPSSDTTCASLAGGVGAVVAMIGCGMLGTKTAAATFGGVFMLSLAALLFVIGAVSWSASRSSTEAAQRVDVRVFGKPKVRILPRLRCPYCRDSIAGQTRECAGCKTVYHDECLKEAQGCTTLGCAHAAPRRTVRA